MELRLVYNTGMVSVIIPVYNEEKTVKECLASLAVQTYKNVEIIVIDDGSTDSSILKIKKQIAKIHSKNKKYKIIHQNHFGPAVARNLGASRAKGDILVFVDADMTFEKAFIKRLVEPIDEGRTKGTFTKEEFVSNWDRVWARCWNYNAGIFDNCRIPNNYPDTSPVFRAIRKSEFNKVGGFDAIGFTDDWTLSRKLGYKADDAPGAICYHRNPDSLFETYRQARWIGKNEFISGSLIRKMFNVIRYSLFMQLFRGFYISVKTGELLCIPFQLVFGFGINVSILGSILGEQKNK